MKLRRRLAFIVLGLIFVCGFATCSDEGADETDAMPTDVITATVVPIEVLKLE